MYIEIPQRQRDVVSLWFVMESHFKWMKRCLSFMKSCAVRAETDFDLREGIVNEERIEYEEK